VFAFSTRSLQITLWEINSNETGIAEPCAAANCSGASHWLLPPPSPPATFPQPVRRASAVAELGVVRRLVTRLMELFGLILAVPFTLLSSTAFCSLALWAFRRFPMLQSPIAVGASVILCSVALEFILSLAVGPLALHHRFDGVHSALHFANFVLAPPAIACVILVVALRRGVRPIPLRIAAICVCWFACMASLLGNIVVSEAIYGIDGSGIPPTQSP